jgi:hypothetical protein
VFNRRCKNIYRVGVGRSAWLRQREVLFDEFVRNPDLVLRLETIRVLHRQGRNHESITIKRASNSTRKQSRKQSEVSSRKAGHDI